MKKLTVFMAAFSLALGVSAQVKESDYYEIISYPASDDTSLTLEICSMTLLQDGNLMLGTRLGDIYYVEHPYEPEKAKFTKFARGLNHPLGMVEHEGAIYLAQRGELTRLRDTNGDHKADEFETVCDEWAISGNYHEFNFGPRLDKEGYMWVTLNKPFGRNPTVARLGGVMRSGFIRRRVRCSRCVPDSARRRAWKCRRGAMCFTRTTKASGATPRSWRIWNTVIFMATRTVWHRRRVWWASPSVRYPSPSRELG